MGEREMRKDADERRERESSPAAWGRCVRRRVRVRRRRARIGALWPGLSACSRRRRGRGLVRRVGRAEGCLGRQLRRRQRYRRAAGAARRQGRTCATEQG